MNFSTDMPILWHIDAKLEYEKLDNYTYKRPWLAYLCIVIITLIPPAIDILWRGIAKLVLYGYLVRLPIHLLACWSYQKTDNVWTPMISLSITNLLTSVILLVLPFV